jgi:hypothetical protein
MLQEVVPLVLDQHWSLSDLGADVAVDTNNLSMFIELRFRPREVNTPFGLPTLIALKTTFPLPSKTNIHRNLGRNLCRNLSKGTKDRKFRFNEGLLPPTRGGPSIVGRRRTVRAFVAPRPSEETPPSEIPMHAIERRSHRSQMRDAKDLETETERAREETNKLQLTRSEQCMYATMRTERVHA